MKEKAALFLRQFHDKLKIWDILFRDDRGKNTQTLATLEISPNDRKKELEKITLEDYSEGPLMENLYGMHEMWVFGRKVKGQEIYIKISLGVAGASVICISFHLAQYPMKYPFKH